MHTPPASNDETGIASAIAEPHAVPGGPPAVFYRLNAAKLTLKELWRSTPSPLVMYPVLVLKVFRAPVPCSTDDVAVESLNGFLSGPPPAAVQKAFEASFSGLGALGFQFAAFHTIEDHLQSTATFLATFTHPTLPVVARAHMRVWAIFTPPKVRLFTEFITAYADGGYLWTMSSRADMAAPAACRVARKLNAPPAELFSLHQQERAKEPPFRKALPASTPDDVLATCDSLQAAVCEFHIKRGVFEPLTEADLARTARSRQLYRGDPGAAAGAEPAPASKHPQVMLQLDALLKGKTGKLGAILLFAVSLGVFLLVAFKGQNASSLELLGLVPVLLFHEAGHYLAMRVSGYRNLRMFFIPGFGAAVSGRAFNVPGWKQVFVSLMGPVPGIVLGIVVGLCGIVLKQKLAIDAGLMLVALNGFNLIPILPLDGGRVLHTTLFARHYVLDIVFKSLAAVVLIGVGVLVPGMAAMRYIAIGLIVAMPYMVRVARVAHQLRKEGFTPTSEDGQSIPVEVVDQIVPRLQAASKKPQSSKVLAQQTLSVFETLNVRPPGVLASMGLISVHMLSLVAAVVFSVVFVLAHRGTLNDLARAAANAPRHNLSAAAIRSTPETAAPAPIAPPVPAPASTDGAAPRPAPTRMTIVATYKKTSAAAAAYESAAAGHRPEESITLFGDTLLIGLPAADDAGRKRWLAELQPGGADVFVEAGKMHASFRVQGLAHSDAAAKEISEELSEFFALPDREDMIAPWSACTLTPEQALARRTYRRLETIRPYRDPAAEALIKKRVEAQRQGEEAEAKALDELYTKLIADLRRKAIQEIVDDRSGAVDSALAQRYLALFESTKPDEFYKARNKEFGPLLGRVGDDPACTLTCAQGGWATHTSRVVQIDGIEFVNPAAGATAITTWLTDKGITGLHYSVEADSYDPEND